MTTTRATTFAAAAALLALSGAAISTPVLAKGAQTVHCYGVNTCKGTSDCKSGNHDCKGLNDCKGQGFKELSSKTCIAQRGNLTPPSN